MQLGPGMGGARVAAGIVAHPYGSRCQQADQGYVTDGEYMTGGEYVADRGYVTDGEYVADRGRRRSG